MITLFGAPGSGKSVQGQMLARKLGWAWYSSRDMLSSMHDKDIMYKLDHGMFVDDDTMNGLMQDVMRRAHARGTNRVVLDGFPSSYRQVRWMIDHKEIQYLTGAIVLRVPHGELWKRLMERKRIDDTRAAIERRQDLYDRSVTGMIRALSMENVQIREVNGMGTEEDVFERIKEVLGEWELIPRKQYEKVSRNVRIDYQSRI